MTTYALLAFAVVFFLVGVVRIVEFKGAGISRRQRLVLIPLHLLGSLAFSSAIVFLALDTANHYQTYSSWAFYGGIVILFPLHIYVALKRRLRMTSRNAQNFR